MRERSRIIDWLGGTRFLSVLILLWVPLMVSLVWGLASKNLEAFRIAAPLSIPGMIAYVTAKTWEHVKELERNGKQNG
jgi:putative effector of murein hydrolase LrgA (UPF0299 family)